MGKWYRYQTLKTQLDHVWNAYRKANTKQNRIRLNRLILEAKYPEDITMSIPSLPPFIMTEISHISPEETVLRLDNISVQALGKVKELPEQLSREPL